MAGLQLRLVSSRAPYHRAGLRFEPGPDRSFGLVIVDPFKLTPDDVAQLLADPHIDVMIGGFVHGFRPLTAMEDLGLLSGLAQASGDPDGFDPDDRAGHDAGMERLVTEFERAATGGPMGDEAPADRDAIDARRGRKPKATPKK